MSLTAAAVYLLAQQCAPGIAPETLVSLVHAESALDPLAINVNRVGRIRSPSYARAVDTARRWIVAGYSVDLGLAQINSKNLRWSKLSIAAAFDPCHNLAAAQRILTEDYAVALRSGGGLGAISRAFSLYNTGNILAGFSNHYTDKVWLSARTLFPATAPPKNIVEAAATIAESAAPVWVVDTVGSVNDSVLVFNKGVRE